VVSVIHSTNLEFREHEVSSQGYVGRALVYLEGVPKGIKYETPSEECVVTRDRCRFTPDLVAIRVGQALRVEDPDGIEHTNTLLSDHSPRSEAGFAPSSETLTFQHEEEFVILFCALHGWERAHIAVLPHPFYAITDSAGAFEIPVELPPGRYHLRVERPGLGCASEEIELKVQYERLDKSIELLPYPKREPFEDQDVPPWRLEEKR
jgi:plastocyanin